MRKDIPSKILIITIIALFITLKLFYLGKPHLPGWDESVYLAMGKYIYSAGQSGLWENIRPPLLPLIVGIFWKFGLNGTSYAAAAEVIIVILAAATILLTYLITKKLLNSHAAIIASLLLASTPLFFSSTSLIMTAIPSVFFALLGWYFYMTKKHPFFVGLAFGASILTRFPQILIIAAYFLSIFLQDNNLRENIKVKIKNVIIMSLGVVVIYVPFGIVNYILYREETSNILIAIFRPFILGSMHQTNPFHSASFFFYISEITAQNMLFLFAVVAITALLITKKRIAYFLLIAPTLIIMYLTIIQNKQSRFVLITLPYIAILAGIGLYRTIAWIKSNKHKKSAYVSAAALSALIILAIVPLPGQLIEDYKKLPARWEEPAFFFDRMNQFEGPILTMHPTPAAYTNALYIPMYDNPDIAIETYQKNKDISNYVLSFNEFYPCTDPVCIEKKEILEKDIKSKPIINQTTVGTQQFILATLSE